MTRKVLVIWIAIAVQLPLALAVGAGGTLGGILGHVPVCHDAPWRFQAAVVGTQLADCGHTASLPDEDDDPPADAVFEAEVVEAELPAGSFNICNWDGYPTDGLAPRPAGPFRLLTGTEYQDARTAANNANRALHAAHPENAGLHYHEIKPVKFGGSPTDTANKVVLTPAQHNAYSQFWKTIQNNAQRFC